MKKLLYVIAFYFGLEGIAYAPEIVYSDIWLLPYDIIKPIEITLTKI